MGYKVGDHFLCTLAQDNLPHECEVIEKRKAGKADRYQYYIHFVGADRRLDQWVSHDRLTPLPAAAAVAAAGSAVGVPSGPLSPPGFSRSVSLPNLQSGGLYGGASPMLSPMASPGRRMTRRDKRKFGGDAHGDGHGSGHGGHTDPTEAALEREHAERTRVKNIGAVHVGAYLIDTWYYSPYPEEFRNVNTLYVCEYCLKYMKKLKTLERHKKTCTLRHPPGDEIYRHENISVFQVDGAQQKIYCQCLCLFSKLFIDHKTLYYDVAPFLFYLLCESDKDGYHIVGYFSKEKSSPENNNLACILTFPQYQRKGYGRFLISLSYELSKLEGKIGSPEKPLSDLGKVSYRSYWTTVLLDLLVAAGRNLSIKEASALTAIKREDIITTLQYLGLIRYCKGQHVICSTPKLLQQHLKALHQTKKPSAAAAAAAAAGEKKSGKKNEAKKSERAVLVPAKLASWKPPVFPPVGKRGSSSSRGGGNYKTTKKQKSGSRATKKQRLH